MKNLFNLKTKTVNNNTNNKNSTKGVKTMKTTKTKKRSFKTRIAAGILSAVTIFSVFGAVTTTSASAFAIPGIAETVLSTTFGYAKD